MSNVFDDQAFSEFGLMSFISHCHYIYNIEGAQWFAPTFPQMRKGLVTNFYNFSVEYFSELIDRLAFRKSSDFRHFSPSLGVEKGFLSQESFRTALRLSFLILTIHISFF